MYTEIETKLKVNSLEPIRDRLAEVGADFIEDQKQIDYYLDDANRTLTIEDKCLRLRVQHTGDGKKFLVAYKGAKFAHEIKKRTEIEFFSDNLEAAQELFEQLGYMKVLEVVKNRQLWRMDDCEVTLDEVAGLGTFVEIEGVDAAKIALVKGKLLLGNLPHIVESYACLMENRTGEK